MVNKQKTVLFYSSVKDKELFSIQQFYQIDIQILKELGYSILLSNKISDAWKFWNYDFVFAYFYRYSFFVALIAKLWGKGTYFTGGIDALDKNLVSRRDYTIQKYFFKLCYLVSKKCIIVSRTDEKNVNEIVSGKKLVYSEHTINTQPFNCEKDKKRNIFTTIGWQATVENVQRKGIDTSLRIFSQLIKHPDFSDSLFYIIGKKGEGSLYLENIIQELNLKDSIIFTDSISEDEKINYLKQSKYYFQLSKFEGFGIAALEALCAKNIVIHSGKGGLSNPIYQDSIQIDISRPIEKMAEELISRLQTFDESCLETAHTNVCSNYDNKRRKGDFRRIIDERT